MNVTAIITVIFGYFFIQYLKKSFTLRLYSKTNQTATIKSLQMLYSSQSQSQNLKEKQNILFIICLFSRAS